MSDLLTKNTVVTIDKKEIFKEIPSFSPKKDKLGRSYGTGRRKTSVARVWIKSGTGKIIVNKKDINNYFKRNTHVQVALTAMVVSNVMQQFDIMCTVKGGGYSGQAGAIKLGAARALNNFNPEVHNILRQSRCLTCDSRRVERKKAGKLKARKSRPFAKR